MDADGTDVRQLTDNGLHDEGPAWSPDGRLIAFTRSDTEDAPGDVWVMNADGSDAGGADEHSGDRGVPDWQPLPITVGAADELRTACGDLSLVPGGVASVVAVKSSMRHRARDRRRLARRSPRRRASRAHPQLRMRLRAAFVRPGARPVRSPRRQEGDRVRLPRAAGRAGARRRRRLAPLPSGPPARTPAVGRSVEASHAANQPIARWSPAAARATIDAVGRLRT